MGLIGLVIAIVVCVVACRRRRHGEALAERQHEWPEPPLRREHFLKFKPASRRDSIVGYQSSRERRHPEPFHLPGDWIAQYLPRTVDAPHLRAMPTADEQQYLVAPFRPADLERLGLTLAGEEGEAGDGRGGGGEEKS